jgi:hypothetical protein
MTDSDRAQPLWHLTNELLVVSALLDILTSRHATLSDLNRPSMLDMCSSSNMRCQNLVDQLLKIELRSNAVLT